MGSHEGAVKGSVEIARKEILEWLRGRQGRQFPGAKKGDEGKKREGNDQDSCIKEKRATFNLEPDGRP